MLLKPMGPSPLTASGVSFRVLCSTCGKECSSTDVDCDLDAKPWTFYCQMCVIKNTLEEMRLSNSSYQRLMELDQKR